MNLQTAEQHVRDVLREIYDASEAAAIARLVLEQITGMGWAEIRREAENDLDSRQENLLMGYVQRLKNQEPVQYVLQEAWFYGLKLYVDQRVLIPRPETEELVHWIREDLSGVNAPVKLLDLCTGSGCIALAVRSLFPSVEAEGCDVSIRALEVAQKNARLLNLPVSFFTCDVLHPLGALNGKTYDIMVSNPPYISQAEALTLAAHVRDFEPHQALFAPDSDSLLFYRSIGALAIQHLTVGGRLYFEIHEDRAAEVISILKTLGFSSIVLRKDLQGKERMLRAVREGSPND